MLLVLSVVAAARSPHKRVKSPKAVELESSSGKPMASPSVRLMIPAPFFGFTNDPPAILITKHVMWRWPSVMDDVIGFNLYRGTNSGNYFTNYTTGLVTNVDVSYFRMPLERDFFLAVAVDVEGLESEPSNEAAYPPVIDATPVRWIRVWTTNVASIVLQICTNAFNPNEFYDYGHLVQDNSYIIPVTSDYATFRAVSFNQSESNKIFLRIGKYEP